MRLHRLLVSAWGPFADTVVVDFDRVAEHGLYLVHGATGAGKTSLLDAVSYALYGAVPGVRSGVRDHASHHAQPGSVPTVELELTASGRRLRVRRTGAFRRPGRGTEVHASVRVEEFRQGTWQVRSTRAREADDIIVNDVVGLGRDQFATVVMLPQGDFARFLQAAPEERRTLLDRLFDVQRFVDVERWLADRRRSLAAEESAARAHVDALIARMRDSLATIPPEAGLADPGQWLDLIVPGGQDAVPRSDRAQAGLRVVDELTRCRQTAAVDVDAHESRWRAADAALTTGLAVAERQHRWATARAEAVHLDAEAPLIALRRSRLADAERAAQCLDAVAMADRLEQRARAAEVQVAQLCASFGRTPEDARQDATREALRSRLQAGSAALVTAGEAEQRRAAAAAQVAAATADSATREHVLAEAEGRATAVGTTLATATSRLREQSALAEGLSGQVARLAALEDVAAAVEQRRRLVREREGAEGERLQARSAEVEAQALVNRLRAEELDAMAAELAAGLDDGSACPVCGATSHPCLADPAGRFDRADLEAATRAWEECRARTEAAALHVATVDGRLTGLDAVLRGSPVDRAADLGALLQQARAEVAVARAAAAAVPMVQAEIEALTAQADAAAIAVSTARDAAVASRSRCDSAQEDLLTAGRELAVAIEAHASCPCGGTGDVVGCAAAHRDALRRLVELDRGVADVVVRAAEADDARSRAAARLAESGFADADQMHAAALSTAERTTVRDTVARADAAAAAVQIVLADPDLAAAAELAAPDVAALTEARAAAERDLSAVRVLLSHVRQAERVVDELASALDRAVDHLVEIGQEAALVAGVAEACVGTGGDNTLRMPLSAYVLAARLEEVVEHANARLARMGEGRYRLAHSDALAARGARSGLGLDVVDGWTDQRRSPASLSGGETFMVSLALALGLADAVRAESGGVDLNTLFIDEGFGGLDDDSLDSVLDVLDSLREGGRSVGIVSHVGELRQRIPGQIVVTKTERGSSVSIVDGLDATG